MEDIQREKSEGEKVRIDQLLVRTGKAKSRGKAKEWILAGLVFADGRKAEKPSETFGPEVQIEVRSSGTDYVSRGGKKLEGAISGFGLTVGDLICLDAGASTGGFTDCLLQHGARKVYAVDVGSNQLSDKLRKDPRVISMENTNIRTMDPASIETCDFFCADLSFISLRLVFGALKKLITDQAEGVVLVKPQFEAGKDKVGKGGIVKDPKVHVRVLEEVIRSADEAGFEAAGLLPSPIRGGDGNTEYLLFLKADHKSERNQPDSVKIRETVKLALKEKQRG